MAHSYTCILKTLGATLLLAPGTVALAQAPVITGITPLANARAAARTAPVTVSFNQPLAASSAGALKVFSAQRGGLRSRGATPAVVTGNGLSFAPAARPWLPGETVSYTVTTGSGVGLAQPRVGQFTAAVGGTGRGYYRPAPDALVSRVPLNPTLADVDGDGDLDLLTANYSSASVSICLNNGQGTLTNSPDIFGFDNPTSVAVGDLDGDGDLDFLVTHVFNMPSTATVFVNNGLGNFSRGQDVVAGITSRNVTLGDVDGDGDLDLLFADSLVPGTVITRLNNDSGTFGSSQSTATSNFPDKVVLGDVDSDGDLDLLVSCTTSRGGAQAMVSVRLNNGNGTFSGTQNVAVSTTGLEVVDWDSDGDLDLLTANPMTSTVNLQLNNGRGTFGSSQPLPVSGSFDSMVLGDADGDGDLDLFATPGPVAGLVNVFLNAGNTSFGSARNVAVGLFAGELALGDLDADGDLDFVILTNDPFMPGSAQIIANVRINQQSLGNMGGRAATGLALVPNPARTTATLTGTAPHAPITVFDALGRPVLTATADASGAARLALPAGLAAGVYLVRSGAQVRRLAVE